MTSLRFPGLSSQSVSGFLGTFWPENPETDWDDKLGLLRLVMPVRFGFCWSCLARKKRTGMTSLSFPYFTYFTYFPYSPRVLCLFHLFPLFHLFLRT